jgi:hypothetical protein
LLHDRQGGHGNGHSVQGVDQGSRLGRELSNFRKGEIHAVPTAVAGVLLAQGCAEPVSDDTPELRKAS